MYVTFGDYSDNDDGFLMVVNTGSHTLTSAYAGARNPAHSTAHAWAGMWAASGPALDSAGRIYVTTGNTTITTPDAGNWGMSLLVFNPPTQAAPNLTLAGTYTPWNYVAMENSDMDLCGGGTNVLPDLPGQNAHVVAFGGKQGNCYIVDRDNLPGGTTQRPANGLTSSQDGSLFSPTIKFSYYTNGGTTPTGAPGPLHVFGSYSESGNNGNAAKSRTTPAVYQTADGTWYLVHTGLKGQTSAPPCVARLKVNTSPSAVPYLNLDATEGTQTYMSPGSPVITSNGTSGFVSWNLDTNTYRGTGLVGSHPYLVGVDPTSTPIKTIYQSAMGTTVAGQNSAAAVSTLHAGGKYNEPIAARGMVFVGTDRLQIFGITSYVYAIACGGSSSAPGDTTNTRSATTSGGTINVTSTTTGKTFTPDANFTGGTANTTANVVNVTGVSNPAPAAVYGNCRVGTSSTGFSYTFPHLIAGSNYSVRLHFCETVATASGQRKFNVLINGNQVLTNYDVYATCGAQNVACEEPFAAIADTGGNITIVFTPAAGTTQGPMVSGIEINALPTSVTQEYFFDWQAQYGLIGTLGNPTADSSGDGIPNAWKYFTAANPLQHGDRITLLPQFNEVNSGGSNYLQFTYLRRIDYASRGFSIAVQTSPDLSPGSWTTQTAAQVGNPVPTGDGVTETAVIRLSNPVPNGTDKLYARVQLTLAN